MIIRIKQVDAFTSVPFGGNPAGVVTDANALSHVQMQNIAREMNLSETAFISRSEKADFKVRFFTPQSEVDLCGHATIGAFSALDEEGLLPKDRTVFYQETKAGILPIEVETQNGNRLFMMTQAVPTFEDIPEDHAFIASLLGLDREHLMDTPVQKVSTGIPWLLVGVKKLRYLADAKPDFTAIKEASKGLDVVGMIPFCLEAFDTHCHYHIRAFAPYVGINEDPVCGTGNACVASYLAQYHLLDAQSEVLELIGEQGNEVERPGRVYSEIKKDAGTITEVKIGGYAVTVMDGEMRLPL